MEDSRIDWLEFRYMNLVVRTKNSIWVLAYFGLPSLLFLGDFLSYQKRGNIFEENSRHQPFLANYFGGISFAYILLFIIVN